MTNLVAADVHKSFGQQQVLRGFDLRVDEGTLAAIVGPSGSGKTTFLRIAAGFERADKGTISLGDLVVDGPRYVPPESRGIGYVPQEGALFPHLNVRRNVGFGLRRADRHRVDELLELVGLAGLDRRYPHELSGGQQQRVALARALAIRPRVVLLDEPFSSLDAGLRANVRSDVRHTLRAAGTTAVLVTHDQDEALSFADRVAVLREGRIVQASTPADVYRRPADSGVATFLGQANLLAGIVEEHGVRCALGLLDVHEPPPPGTAVTVLVRPEQVRVDLAAVGTGGSEGGGGSAPGADERPVGTVVHEDFYGHDAVVDIELTSDHSQRMIVRTSGDEAPPVGACVSLRVVGEARVWTS